MFKKILVMICALSGATVMTAETYPWLSFKMADATEISVVAADLEIRYADNLLHLSSASVNQTLPVDQILSMSFSSTATGLGETLASDSPEAEYFTLDGVAAGHFATPDEARAALPSGIYVAKSASATIKVVF